jgi:predicted ATPase
VIKSVRFLDYRVLKDALLPLSRVTVLVGPNGSGKSTAVQALSTFGDPRAVQWSSIRSFTAMDKRQPTVRIDWSFTHSEGNSVIRPGVGEPRHEPSRGALDSDALTAWFRRIRAYSLEPEQVAVPVVLAPDPELRPTGAGLAAVLDNLRDLHPELFEELNVELRRWFPEYDRILFETPSEGRRAFLLRTKVGGFPTPAKALSQGTLSAFALLTLAYLAEPPSMICLEEPDRGIHPRLLRHIVDAIYRLAYPEEMGLKRPAVQVVATTHNPLFLDLFKEHPEEVVIASKIGLEAKFQQLSKMAHIDEILQTAPLGDIWYTGVLGGVPEAA